MSEATAPLPALAPPRDPDARIDRAVALFAECVRVNREASAFMADLMAGRETPVEAMMLVNRVADIGYDLRNLADLPAALRDAALIQAAGLTVPLAAAPEPEPAPARHRARARQKGRHASDRPLMRVLPSGALLPVGAFAFRHLLTRKTLLTAGASSVALTGAAGALHHAHTLPYDTGTLSPPAASMPYDGPYSAVPITYPSWSRPVVTITPPKPAGKHHAPAVTLTVTPPPQVPTTAPSDSWGSSTSSDASLSPDLSPSSGPSGDDGSGGGGKQQRRLDRQLRDDASGLAGGLSGDGSRDDGTGRHRRHDQGGILQLGDQGGQYQGRHDAGSGDGGSGQQGGNGQQGSHDGGHGHGGN